MTDMIERVAKAINDVYEPGYYNPKSPELCSCLTCPALG